MKNKIQDNQSLWKHLLPLWLIRSWTLLWSCCFFIHLGGGKLFNVLSCHLGISRSRWGRSLAGLGGGSVSSRCNWTTSMCGCLFRADTSIQLVWGRALPLIDQKRCGYYLLATVIRNSWRRVRLIGTQWVSPQTVFDDHWTTIMIW